MSLSLMAEQETSQLRKQLLELTEICPVEQCNPEDCPLFPVRKMKRSERVQWFNSLTAEDLVYLATYHYVCIGIKFERLAQRRAEHEAVCS